MKECMYIKERFFLSVCEVEVRRSYDAQHSRWEEESVFLFFLIIKDKERKETRGISAEACVHQERIGSMSSNRSPTVDIVPRQSTALITRA